MNPIRNIVLALLLLAPALPNAAAAETTVTLVVDTIAGQPQIAACEVSVPAGSNVETVLDAALAQGCIVQWSCSVLFSSPGNCFLDSIDFVLAPGLPTWWAFRVNGELSDVGISQKTVVGGETIRFSLDQSVFF